MRPDLATMIERVTLLRERCARGARDEGLLEQIEDVLSEGYAQALAGDAWSNSTEERLQQRISGEGEPFRARRLRLRLLATEHAQFQRELVALRRGLAELRHDRDRLCVGSDRRSAR
ncbi:MAG: hypothetical protein KY463_11160 [Actinobacteria bacterium]|nr:hypothetical protein [Actinomycetota bacterium]